MQQPQQQQQANPVSPPEPSIAQLLVELPLSDSRIRMAAEEARLVLEPSSYLAANTSAESLADFLDSQRKLPSAVPCRLVHITLVFSQPILLETGAEAVQKPGVRAARCQLVGLEAIGTGAGKYRLVALSRYSDKALLPVVEANGATFINCSAYTTTLQLTVAITQRSSAVSHKPESKTATKADEVPGIP